MRWDYPEKSAQGFTLPVLHSDGIPYPKSSEQKKKTPDISSQESVKSNESLADSNFQTEKQPKLLGQM